MEQRVEEPKKGRKPMIFGKGKPLGQHPPPMSSMRIFGLHAPESDEEIHRETGLDFSTVD